MEVTPSSGLRPLLTYEAYLEEAVVNLRYSIIDGERIFTTAPTWRHQRILGNILIRFMAYEKKALHGFSLGAPFDILIRRSPLCIRQPDVFFISSKRLADAGGIPERGPLHVGPELVVEVISDTEKERELMGKLADYITVG